MSKRSGPKSTPDKGKTTAKGKPASKSKPPSKGKVDGGRGKRPSTRSQPGAAAARLAAQTRPLELLPDHPSHYRNRELSLLEFNRRVLAQARDESLPLLERLRFLAICSSNLDEFFEIRVAGLREQINYDLGSTGPDRTPPRELMAQVSRTAHDLVTQQYQVLHEELRPGLEQAGIRAFGHKEWNQRQRAWLDRYFEMEVQPVLTPMGLDPAHPFPQVLNKGLSFLVELEGSDAFGRGSGIAVIQAPRSLPRLVRLPRSISRVPHGFVLLSTIIHEHVEHLFPGMRVVGCYQFRITRNSDLWVDEEEVDNLLHALQGELPNRRFGQAVRLEVTNTCPDHLVEFLLQETGLTERDLYTVRGPVNLHRVSAIYEHVDRPDLKFEPFLPGVPRRLKGAKSIWATLRRRDVLLHHPFEQFTPVVDLLRAAARDPKVLAIKQTLYRTGADSPVVAALVEAARNGKEVTALVELRARFDEERNIDLATTLQAVGANVVYGIVGFKAHSKLLMIVRREGGRIRRYVHMGTGNYHTGTARAYTDFGLLTCDADMGEDVHNLFMQLTGLGKPADMHKVLQSPFTLYKTIIKMIQRETREAKAGRPAQIIAKMNQLTERNVIRALYEASQAGVKVDLIVRGTCCLLPGITGVSENIRLRSIVGRFLEHTRIYYFHAKGEGRLYAGSADWMSRNLHRRVETCFPIEDEKVFKRMMKEGLEVYLEDNQQAWELQSDGTYVRLVPDEGVPARSAQALLLGELAD